MPRFFTAPDTQIGSFAVLTGENANHARVLRLGCGDEVILCDGRGTDYRCTISDMSPGQVSLVVHHSEASSTEPAVFTTVYMAFAKADKFEHVVQKATELGASAICAFPSSRCVSRPDEKALAKKLDRWQKIAASAAEQSGRGRIPAVTAASSYEQALRLAAEADFSAFFYENEAHLSLGQALSGAVPHTAALMTGPEGGFTEDEVRAAGDAGLRICSLGSRILRCETAPLCALSALMFAAGEF